MMDAFNYNPDPSIFKNLLSDLKIRDQFVKNVATVRMAMPHACWGIEYLIASPEYGLLGRY